MLGGVNQNFALHFPKESKKEDENGCSPEVKMEYFLKGHLLAKKSFKRYLL